MKKNYTFLLYLATTILNANIMFASDEFYSPLSENEIPIPELDHIQVLEDISTKNALNESQRISLKKGVILPIVERNGLDYVCMVTLPDGSNSAPVVSVNNAQLLSLKSLPPLLSLAEDLVVSQSESSLAIADAAKKAFPNIRFFRAVSELRAEITKIQQSLAQVPSMKTEAERIRRNASVIDKPNLLNPNDDSGERRAAQDRERAAQMEKEADAISQRAEDSVSLLKAKIVLISNQVLEKAQKRASTAKLIAVQMQQQRDQIASDAASAAQKLVDAKNETERVERYTLLLKEQQRRELLEKSNQQMYQEFNNANAELFEQNKRQRATAGEAVGKLRLLDFYLGGGYTFQNMEN